VTRPDHDVTGKIFGVELSKDRQAALRFVPYFLMPCGFALLFACMASGHAFFGWMAVVVCSLLSMFVVTLWLVQTGRKSADEHS
jgi:hypothetical protein